MVKMEIEDIRRIKVSYGDKLVLRCKDKLSLEQVSRIRSIFDKFAPGCPLLILDVGMSLDVLSENPK